MKPTEKQKPSPERIHDRSKYPSKEAFVAAVVLDQALYGSATFRPISIRRMGDANDEHLGIS